MKKILLSVFCAAFLFSTNAVVWGVEKKQKTGESKTSQHLKKKSAAPKPAEPVDLPAQMKKPEAKKYDSFVDENKNGIDDRRESLIKKSDSPKAQSPEPAPSEKESSERKAGSRKKN